MSVLIIVENHNGEFKKSAYEIVHYGAMAAKSLGVTCQALVIGENTNAEALGQYGAEKVLQINNYQGPFDALVYSKMIKQVATAQNSSLVVLNHSANGKALAGVLSAQMDVPIVGQVSSVPKKENDQIVVEKPVFSGKAFATYAISGTPAILSLMGNAIPPEKIGENCKVEAIDVQLSTSRITIKEVKKVEGTTPLPEAELVVSAGRGMKGPENWGIIEELADTLGATTACSRPVADNEWRPHHEHVGQTGVAIRPNLYIAIGISGAIQHLAGVNNSKCIVVINKDPEAPFFKEADYGVCADLFDVVPRLTEAIAKEKAS